MIAPVLSAALMTRGPVMPVKAPLEVTDSHVLPSSSRRPCGLA
jgi:hypothetical protein